MNTTDLCKLLLGGTDKFMINQLMIGTNEIALDLESRAESAVCPKCGAESRKIHSHYKRFPTDLAWAEWPIVLHLRVKRFFCVNHDCPKRTFAERFPEFVARYARRTNRVHKRQQQVGVEVAARTAEWLLSLDHIGVSDSTINRIIRQLPESDMTPVRVLGVDDWAKRKGQNYGTILVDLERGQVVDLLPDRTAETLAQWLQEIPSPEIVSRDRSATYAEGIRQGAPKAIQVADRWHLLKNLSDAVFKILQQEYPAIKGQLESAAEQDDQDNQETLPDQTESKHLP